MRPRQVTVFGPRFMLAMLLAAFATLAQEADDVDSLEPAVNTSELEPAVAARIELNRLLNLDPNTVIIPILPEAAEPENAPSVPLAVQIDSALSRRPDLQHALLNLDALNVRKTLLSREVWPDLILGAVAERDEFGGTRWGPRISVSLPLWNRSPGPRGAAEVEVAQAGDNLEAIRLRIVGEVTAAVSAVETSRNAEQLLRRTVLEPANRLQGQLDEAIAVGELDLPTALLLRRTLLESELDYWSEWLRARYAEVRLASVTASTESSEVN